MSDETHTYGELTDDELRAIQQLQVKAQSLLIQIGNVEIQKNSLIHSYTGAQSQAETVVREAARRVGIPADATFRLEGKSLVGTPPSEESPSEGEEG
ncbi:MAG: hypothetical protein LAT68_15870 [Cyclobacteriaceae bacterium]|nr:hypothetical protein [Cyclobacteriaceae bacterium]